MKKNSGKISDGKKNAGLVTKLWIVRQATAWVTSRKRLMSAPASFAGRRRTAVIATAAIAAASPNPSASASPSQPVMISERTPSTR